jgi:predicted dehydrogenase
MVWRHAGSAQVLDDPAIDTVVLATPHSQHVEQVVASAVASKHIFVEKPFTLIEADAKKAVAAASRTGRVLALDHNRRFLPAIAALSRRRRSWTGASRRGQLLGSLGL